VTKTLELPRVALLSTSCDADSVAEGQLRSLHELLSKQNADGQPALNSGSSHTSLRRSKLPSSDLNEDGRLLMQRYWHIFPLLRYKDETSADQRSTERKWYPLSQHATLYDTDARHLLLQYSNAFASETSLLFVLANQKQRHSVLKSVGARVNMNSFDAFKSFVAEPDFATKLKAAIDHPRGQEAKEIQQRILPMLSLTGRYVPRGKLERASLVGQLLGMHRRYGPPSYFLTISPDDIRQPTCIRLCFKSVSNESFPATVDASKCGEWPSNFLEALRGGTSWRLCKV